MSEPDSFELNSALKAYLDDAQTILTPDADPALLDCENDPNSYTTTLVNGALDTISEAIGDTPIAILSSAFLDTLQFLLK